MLGKKQATKSSKSNLTEEDFDFNFKFLMLGNPAVGKSCFLVRYTQHSFTVGTRCSVGIDVAFKSVIRNDKKIKLRIMDTAGQERFRAMTRNSCRGAMGFIVMYDIGDQKSLDDVPGWIADAKEYSNDNVQIVLVGNKCDCEARRIVAYEQGQELANQLGCPFFEASIKDNVNVDEAFDKLIDIICDNMRATAESEPTENGDANAGIVHLRNAEEEDVAGGRKWCPLCK